MIAARAVGAPTAVIALKATFVREIERVERAIAEMEAAGWVDRGVLSVFEGPREYLYGEETALLESVAGRPPFPRIAPPWRRGATEVVEDVDDTTSESGLAAPVLMAGETEAPPALVNNVETIANVPGIIANGADWFRSLGTDESPGTIVCTVSGSTKRAGVAEIPMGTPLRVAIETIGGGVDVGRRVTAVLMGVANAALTGDQLDTPLSYEAMRDAGSGLGSAGAIVFTDDDDLLAAAAGVARFLAVESCGQCTPCKQDGLALAARLTALCAGAGEPDDAATVTDLLATVADGARCALAGQQQSAVGSLVALAGGHPRPTADGASRRSSRCSSPSSSTSTTARPSTTPSSSASSPTGPTTRSTRVSHPSTGSPTSAPTDASPPIWARTAGQSHGPPAAGSRHGSEPPRTSQVGSAGSVRASSASAAAAAVIVPSRTAASISAVGGGRLGRRGSGPAGGRRSSPTSSARPGRGGARSSDP